MAENDIGFTGVDMLIRIGPDSADYQVGDAIGIDIPGCGNAIARQVERVNTVDDESVDPIEIGKIDFASGTDRRATEDDVTLARPRPAPSTRPCPSTRTRRGPSSIT